MVVCDYSMKHARLGQIVLQAKKSGNLSGFQTFVGRKLTSTEISAIKCLKDFPIQCVEGEKLYFLSIVLKSFRVNGRPITTKLLVFVIPRSFLRINLKC